MAMKLKYLTLVVMDAFYLFIYLFSPSSFSSFFERGEGDHFSKSTNWLKYVKITHNNV
jgi:hypothetical protein